MSLYSIVCIKNKKMEWNEMKFSGIYSIPFLYLPLIPPPPIWVEWDEMAYVFIFIRKILLKHP